MLIRCPNGHAFNKRLYGTICPYCHIDAGKAKPALTADETAEIPIDYEAERPVCGWLVCVEGPSKGRDYKIREGKNFVGRNDEMDIQILGDNKISQSKHAIIAYDSKHRKTTLLPGDSNGIAYWQGEPVYTPVTLESDDILEIGMSKFMFVPFCGDRFGWGDVGKGNTGQDDAERDAENAI